MKVEAEQFAAAVERFVELCEEASSADDRPERLYRVLTELIRLAWRLPDDYTGKGPDDYGIDVSEAEYRRVYSNTASVIDTQFYDYSWPDGEVTTADTADDLADIYRDLKPGLALWQRGGREARSGAVWSWRCGHKSHWGAHATGLHSVLGAQVRKAGLGGARLLDGEPEFFEAVLSRRPKWAPYISRLPTSPGERWTAQVEVPSPTGDSSLNFALWLDDCDPSISFGPWHTHTQSLEELWPYIQAIEEDLLVLITDLGGPYDGTTYQLDLREKDALLDHMTHEAAPPKVRIRTFTGAGDRVHP